MKPGVILVFALTGLVSLAMLVRAALGTLWSTGSVEILIVTLALICLILLVDSRRRTSTRLNRHARPRDSSVAPLR